MALELFLTVWLLVWDLELLLRPHQVGVGLGEGLPQPQHLLLTHRLTILANRHLRSN